nr:NADH dehydrogenase subunit 4 [Artemidia motanka]
MSMVVGVLCCVLACSMYRYTMYASTSIAVFFLGHPILFVVDLYVFVFVVVFLGVCLVWYMLAVTRVVVCILDSRTYVVSTLACSIAVCISMDIALAVTAFEVLLVIMVWYMLVVTRVARGTLALYMLTWYTVIGSCMLISGVTLMTVSTGVVMLTAVHVGGMYLGYCYVVVCLCVVGLCAKLPAWPLHHWLSVAHVECTTEGSTMLAGVYLKVGFLLLLRALHVLGTLAYHRLFFFFFLVGCVVGVVSTTAVVCVWVDIKRFIAGCSVVHMSCTAMALLVPGDMPLAASIMCSACHSGIAGALFILCGMTYECSGTRIVMLLRCSGHRSWVWVVLLMSQVGFPCSVFLWGELWLLDSMVHTWVVATVVCMLCSMVLAVVGLSLWVAMVSTRVTATTAIVLSSGWEFLCVGVVGVCVVGVCIGDVCRGILGVAIL